MSVIPARRWNPGFIAMRWRHLFWLLPMLGLSIGLGLHFWKLYTPTATGIIRFRPAVVSSAKISASEVAKVLGSDEVLSGTTYSLNLPARWEADPATCVVKLRGMVQSESIPGSSLLEVRVTSNHRAESIEIWNALAQWANEHFEAKRREDTESKFAAMEPGIEALEQDWDEKRQKLSDAIQSDDLLYRPPGSPAERAKKAEFDRIRTDFEAAQAALEKAKIAKISEQVQLKLMANPVIIHQAPRSGAPTTLWEIIRPLVLNCSIGTGIGMLLSMLLAYLLELAFPRKQTAEFANSV